MEGASGGITSFENAATLNQADIVAQGATIREALGGLILLTTYARAQSATLTATGGTNGGGGGIIQFLGHAKGGLAVVQVYGNGMLDVKEIDDTLSIGSLEGDGEVQLSSKYALQIGANRLSTVFSGTITNDGTVTGDGASIVKIGHGTLTLAGPSSYAGSTTINAGTLLVKTSKGSATGTGPVQVNAGTFGGRSNIAGAVTVGTGERQRGLSGVGSECTRQADH